MKINYQLILGFHVEATRQIVAAAARVLGKKKRTALRSIPKKK
jgi:hypothetical protein